MSSLPSVWDWLVQAIWYIISFISGVVSVLLREVLANYLKKPRIVIETVHRGDKLGFSVSVKRKMVKDAHVKCNNIAYTWENGNTIEKKDLHVGDAPSLFFPYRISAECVEDVSHWERKEGQTTVTPVCGIAINVKEITTLDNAFSVIYSLPKGATAYFIDSKYAKYPQFTASIRIVGEGIEEEKDYPLHIGLSGLSVSAIREGKPLMDFVHFGFEIKKK